MLRPDVDASASRSRPDSAPDGESVPAVERRMLAAHLLERTLLRLGRAGAVIERRLAPGLDRMRGRRLYRRLGYVRLADYLTERLGMSLRRCQSILRLEHALTRLPLLARALEAGEVSVSKLEIAASAATVETEPTWLERATRLPLATLREAAREAAAVTDEATTTDEASASSAAPSLTTVSSPATASSVEQEEPGRLIFFATPAPVVAIWHWTLDLVRRVAGQQEPAWRCAEFLAAEFLSGCPEAAGIPPSRYGDPAACRSAPGPTESHRAAGPSAPASAAAGLVSDPSSPAPGRPASDTPGMAAWIEASAAVREALASVGASADPDAILAEHAASGEHAGSAEAANRDDDLDAWELDACLRRLVRLRQSLAWRQGRLLATFVSLHLHRDLGFDTFDDWAGDRLAMSPRRARYLASLARRLRDLPLLADAYRRGLVSWCQARLLVRVVRPATQSRWIRYARQVTVRRLEEAIVECEVEAATSAGAHAPVMPAHPASIPAAPADISVSPLPPIDPLPHTDQSPPINQQRAEAALPPRDPAPLHTSAPPLDQRACTRVNFDRRTWRRISFWSPLDVASLWDSALRSCRAAMGNHLEDWECFLLFVQAMRETWENQEDPHWRRRYRILERDGWRCKAPGCTSRSGLNAHHITFRSQQGGDHAANLVTLCVGHHQQGLHEGRIRCFGAAPDGLWWDMGVRVGGEPLARYFGDRLVARRPFFSAASVPRGEANPSHALAHRPCGAAHLVNGVAPLRRGVASPPRVAPAAAGAG